MGYHFRRIQQNKLSSDIAAFCADEFNSREVLINQLFISVSPQTDRPASGDSFSAPFISKETIAIV